MKHRLYSHHQHADEEDHEEDNDPVASIHGRTTSPVAAAMRYSTTP